MKITRIRIYRPKSPTPNFYQSDMVVTVETDDGLTGIGEGGARDTLMQCAAMLIGEDPGRIQHLWQMMYRGYFYPAGREKLHALGALDLALWDIKGKRSARRSTSCSAVSPASTWSATPPVSPGRASLGETARACLAGRLPRLPHRRGRCARSGAFDVRRMVEKTVDHCREIRAGDRPRRRLVDRLPHPPRPGRRRAPVHADRAISTRSSIEDPLRSENPGALAALRGQVKVPIAVGEQFGDRWDINELIERHLIDYCPRDPAQRRRDHRIPEDRRAVRDALCRPGAAFHRAHRAGRAGPRPVRPARAHPDGNDG